MRFQIPQYLEIEDKVFGPFGFKQFIYLAGGAGFSYVIFKALPIFIALFFIIPVGALSLALAFYKINNKNFIDVLEAGFWYILGKKLYIWKKQQKKIEKKKKEVKEEELFVPKLSESKLKDIAWSLDVQDSIYKDQKR